MVEDLVLPAGNAARLLGESGWDQTALIAKAAGRLPLTERALTMEKRSEVES